jgi:S-adenosylmethionine hydrolase
MINPLRIFKKYRIMEELVEDLAGRLAAAEQIGGEYAARAIELETAIEKDAARRASISESEIEAIATAERNAGYENVQINAVFVDNYGCLLLNVNGNLQALMTELQRVGFAIITFRKEETDQNYAVLLTRHSAGGRLAA